MLFIIIIEKCVDNCIFVGNDLVYIVMGVSGIMVVILMLMFLMLDDIIGKLVVWDGQKVGMVVGVLVFVLDGLENLLMYWKSGIFVIELLVWLKSVDVIKQVNVFVGSVVSYVVLL